MEKARNIFTVIVLVFLCVLTYYGIQETTNDDLRNYHGYKIKKAIVGRASSYVLIEDSLGHVVKKNFDNEELEELIIGLKIK
jgi:hypothetical protein